MKVKLNKPAYYKGTKYAEGDTVRVNARVGGAWIQTGKADVFSKKTVRTSKQKQTDGSGGEAGSSKDDSKSDD